MFEWLSESIWGYPIIAAIHVLGLAWFGGMVLIGSRELLAWKRVGVTLMLLSGALLFAMHPVRYSSSTAFRIKMLFLLLVLAFRLPQVAKLALWIAIIFAARGIAFF